MNEGGSVFLSYAREDLNFVRSLQAALEDAGLSAWLDLDGIYPGEAFWPEVCKAIDAATAVVFVLTTSSASSEFCRKELDYAAAGGKRLVPVSLGSIDASTVPEPLALLQWVLFPEDTQSAESIDKLLSAIRADWAWLRQHAGLASRAAEWERRGHDRSLMLHGGELRDARGWHDQPVPAAAHATDLQREFIRESLRLQRRRIAQLAGSATASLLAIAITGWLAVTWRIASWNSDGQADLEEERVDEALTGLAAAERVCRFLPLSIERCQDVRMNLGISYRSQQRYEDSIHQFSEVVDEVGTLASADQRTGLLLADALWGRSITRIMLAEQSGDETSRLAGYKLATLDFDKAAALFERLPVAAAHRPLYVTKARLLIEGGAFEEALLVLDSAAEANVSDQKLLMRSLALRCLGDRDGSNDAYIGYGRQFDGKSSSSRFARTAHYFAKVRKRCDEQWKSASWPQ